MVAAANPHAARAAAEVLRAGGSAMDAAIAAQMVLGLVEPQSSGIGGGAFLLYFDAASGTIQAYDGRETAPAAADPQMFLGADGEPMGFYEAVVGGLSVGAPGVPRMLELAHRDYGRLDWGELFQPAIDLAERGFEISPRLAELIAEDDYLATFEGARRYFYDTEGAPKPAGTRLTNPAYADTLRRIAEGGADAFYAGPIAEDIVATVGNAARNPGRLSLADLAGYSAKRREAICRPYRAAWRVCGMPPPTSGGIAVLQMLGILESFDLPALEPNATAAAHLLAEAGRLAFADRNAYVADSDFVDVPVERLLDPTYLRQRAALISRERTLGKAEPGALPQRGALAPQFEPPSTTHLIVVDGDGNAVSMTSSVENAFGSRLMVRGFLLNNQLTDFSFRPSVDGKAVANRVEPLKRPRSSMSPTLVFRPDGGLALGVGSPGGSRIIGYVAHALVGVLDWGLDMQAAIDLPHVVNRNGATDIEAGTPLAARQPALEALGHEVRVRTMTSGLHGIRVGPDGRLDGGADPRREGVAIRVELPGE